MSRSRGRMLAQFALTGIACLVLVLTWAAPASTQDPPNRAKDIGAFHVDLDSTYLLHPGALRAFVATGSDSPHCLVTLQEANDPWIIGPVFCGPRTYEGRTGVLITVFFPGPEGAGEDIYVALTVLQEKARYHATPVLYLGD